MCIIKQYPFATHNALIYDQFSIVAQTIVCANHHAFSVPGPLNRTEWIIKTGGLSALTVPLLPMPQVLTRTNSPASNANYSNDADLDAGISRSVMSLSTLSESI